MFERSQAQQIVIGEADILLAMAGASIALSSSATHSPAHHALSTRDSLPVRFSSISRLCLAKQALPRLRLRAYSFSPARGDGVLRGCGDAFTHHGKFWLFSALDDSASVSTGIKGSEAEGVLEDPDKVVEDSGDLVSPVANDLNKEAFATAGLKDNEEESSTVTEDAVKAKAEAGQKDDGSESAEKFIGVLRDTTEQLKEQAEKTRAALAVTAQETASALAATAQETAAALAVTAQETAERGKASLSYVAENAPDPIKEIADTALKAHSADTPKRVAKIHDFCLGIPYGTFLVVGGLVWFILSGSIAAIRFGVILGGILLALSVSSLNAWKEGKSSSSYIKGQAAISLIITLREVRRLFEVKAFFPTALIALASAGMLGFFCYVHMAGGNPPKKTKQAPAA